MIRAYEKTKTDIECYRSMDCTQNYLNIVSYLSIGRKLGIGSYEAIKYTMKGVQR